MTSLPFNVNETPYEMFIDISMVYGLLNFIGTLATAKYLEMEK